MFGDLMGNMQQKQAELKEKLQNIVITESVEGIAITGTAAKEVTNIEIAERYLAPSKKEELEDLLLVAMNNFTTKVTSEESKASEGLIKDLLPGMGGMLGM